MITAHELSKDYGSVKAIRSATFSIPDRDIVGLLGPNGAGKTTLMKVLTGYLQPSGGTAEIDGIDVVADPLAVQARIGYLPENAPLYPDMLVQEYLQMMADLRELPEDRQRGLISEAVRRTGLGDYLTRPIGQLSKGYRQRVGLAQAILHRPKVLILDEPTSGLDPTQIVEIRQLIRELAKHATVLLSTHILPEVELTCERVLIIIEGEVRADARLDELRASHAAFVSIDSVSTGVAEALRALPAVTEVMRAKDETDAERARAAHFATYRVLGGNEDLCPRIYDLAREKGWRLAELRPDRRTLESIFHSIVDDRSLAARGGNGGGMPA